MDITCVHISVKPEHIEDFILASKLNHEGSVREQGNLRFDVLQSADDPAKFMLYEVYVSKEAAAAHKQTDHYLAWKGKVAEWMAKPREGIKYSAICPTGADQWK